MSVQPARVYMIHLRRPHPKSTRPDDKRSDPFWEFGSFGLNNCHQKNVLNPRHMQEVEGARLAFAQGGKKGMRLLFITGPIHVEAHKRFREAHWAPGAMPFKYPEAPLIVDEKGHSDFPKLKHYISGTRRSGWQAKFSSPFRARSTPLPRALAAELLRNYDKKRSETRSFARTYEEALPSPPPTVDRDRAATYKELLGRAEGK